MADGEEENNSIRVCGMQFSYEGQPPVFADFNLNIKPGSRCLLVGANGSGKSINQSYRFYLFTHSFFTSVNYPFEVRDESRGFFFRKFAYFIKKIEKIKIPSCSIVLEITYVVQERPLCWRSLRVGIWWEGEMWCVCWIVRLFMTPSWCVMVTYPIWEDLGVKPLALLWVLWLCFYTIWYFLKTITHSWYNCVYII